MIDIPELMDKLDRNDDVECYCQFCEKFCLIEHFLLEEYDGYDSHYECSGCGSYYYDNTKEELVDYNRRYVSENDQVSEV